MSSSRFARRVPQTLLLCWLVVVGSLATLSAAAAERTDPQLLVDRTISDLREIVSRDHQRVASDPDFAMTLVRDVVWPHVDMPLASRLVLGKYWQQASAEQRLAFVDGLQSLLLRVFAIHLSEYTDADVKFQPTTYSGAEQQRAIVKTAVTRPGVPEVQVDYRMHLTPAGWKVYDVSIFGVSLVKTYRVTIAGDLEKNGIDSVIHQMDTMMPIRVSSPEDDVAG